MENEIIREGNHGTTASRAESVRANGFQAALGRFGVGVYFWSAGPYSEYLSKSWWDYQNNEGYYHTDSDKTCAIIRAGFQVTEDEFIDLDNEELKSNLAQLCLDRKITSSSGNRKSVAVLMVFLSKLEKALGCKFRLLATTIATAPKKFVEQYPIQLVGAPRCYVVFDPTCISIISINYY